jgi:serine/threonine-protein kinase RsbW
MPTKVFPARLEYLAKISEYILQAAHRAGLDSSAVYAVQLAVDEAATNIIEHAYHLRGGEKIKCSYEILPDGIKIELVDYGDSFDPHIVPDPHVANSIEEVRPRGLGLFFMRKMMDEVTFEFTPEGNVLTMIKRKK